MARYDAPISIRSRNVLSGAGLYATGGVAPPLWALPASPIQINRGASLDLRTVCSSVFVMLFSVDTSSVSLTGTGLSLASNGVLTLASNAPWGTTVGIHIRADDQHGGISISPAFSVLAQLFNPAITAINLLVGATYNLNSLVLVAGAPLFFEIDPTTPLGLTATLADPILTGAAAGQLTMRVIADDHLSATSAPATFISQTVLPSFAGTPLKFGKKLSPFAFNPTDKLLYGIGGEALYAPRNAALLGGTPVLWKFDGATKTLSVGQDYPTGTGNQPSFPDGVGMAYDEYDTSTGIVLLPGTTVASGGTYGAWAGSSTPIANKVMRLPDSTGLWSAGDATALTFPSPMYSSAFRCTITHDFFYCATLVAGVFSVITYDMAARTSTTVAVGTAGFTTLDALTNQVWSGYRSAIICFDWALGRLIQVDPGAPSAAFIMNVPALTARTDAFAMSYDPIEDRVLLFYAAGVYVAELWSGTLTRVGNLPGSEIGLYTAFWDANTRSHFATGAAGGTASIYEYKTPATVEASIPQGQWNDSGLGVTGSYMDKAYQWTWRNQDGRGDYAGTAGVLYPGADTAFATLAFSAQGWIAINATSLLTWWLANSLNAGALLRGTGTYKFKQRRDTDASVRPYLSVVTTAGTVRCECAASTWLGTGSNNLVSQTSTGYLTVDTVSTLLRFDLAPLTGLTITSAAINLNAYSGSGAGTLQLWRLATPAVFEAGTQGALLATASISTGYVYDNGISAHANVVTASDFSTGWQARLNGSGGANLRIVASAADPALGNLVAGTLEFPAYFPAAGSTTSKFTSFARADMSEAWFRIVYNYQDSWGSPVSAAAGGKMGAGWDFRMSTFNAPSGLACGNGGSGSTGQAEYFSESSYTVNTGTGTFTLATGTLTDGVSKCKFIRFTAPTGITEGQEYFVRNPVNVSGSTWTFQVSLLAAGSLSLPTSQPSGTSRCIFAPYGTSGLCGGSARMNYRGTPPEDAWKHFVVPQLYTYYAGTAGTGIDNVFGDPINGYPLFQKNKNYAIEGHIKMNTVVAPFDSLGNGTAVADGAVEYWVDGRQMYSATNVIQRLHPSILVNGYWHDFTHGGTQCTQAQHDVKLNAFVLATTRVGLVRTV